MSVINQMLKDLDQRQAGAERASPQAQPIFAVRPRFSLWLLIGLSGTAIVLALWWFWFGISSQPVIPVQVAQAGIAQDSLQLALPDKTNRSLSNEAEAEAGQLLAAERLQSESVQPDVMSPQPLAMDSALTANSEPKLQQVEPPLQAVQPEPINQTKHVIAEQVQPELRVERVQLSHAEQQQQLRRQALQAEQSGRTSEARSYWQQLQALAPQQSEAYVALARMAQQAGYEAGSQYWLQLGLEQGADTQQLAPLLAASYARQQLWPQVLQVLALLPETSLRPAELATRAAAWQQLGEHQAALAAFEQLGQLEPQQGRWWLGMAISSDALGQRQQAANQFQRSLQLGDDLSAVSKDYIRQRLQELN